MPLTDVIVRNAKSRPKTYKLSDADGMFLMIAPNGSKYWRLKFRFGGKEKVLALGTYPEVSLREARTKREAHRQEISNGIDPSAKRREQKILEALNSDNTFGAIAREWLGKQDGIWTPKHLTTTLGRLERDLLPALGNRLIKDITAPELLMALRKIESRDAIDLAHRSHQTTGQIFRYAIATGRAERDITSDLRGALKTRKKKNHAFLRENELPEFLQRLGNYDGDTQTKIGLKILLLTFVRTGELRGAKWAEIDFEKAEWRIPAERMKMRELHIVPLSAQVIKLLRQQQEISGNHVHLFPNRNRPTTFISENTFLYAIYRMGYHSRLTAHGLRATASTILNERGFRADVIERQLAHGERNNVRASYNHAQYLPERREMMIWWSDYVSDRFAKSPDI